jgi:hypothetical protein
MNSGSELTVKKPVSVWNKPLKANFKDLFKALGKGAINTATGNWTGVAGDVVDATVALGLENDPGQIAWLLIYRSINQAIADLVTDNKILMVKQPPDLDGFCDQLDWSLENLELTIDRKFFNHPQSFPLLTAIAHPLEQWLGGFVEELSQATAIAQRLPTYFVFALNNEWRKRSKDYECLKQVDTPFTKATEQEQAWQEYASWLQKQIEEPLLGVAAFGLQQVYVPLRAYYEREREKTDPISSYEWATREKSARVVVDLGTQLNRPPA